MNNYPSDEEVKLKKLLKREFLRGWIIAHKKSDYDVNKLNKIYKRYLKDNHYKIYKDIWNK